LTRAIQLSQLIAQADRDFAAERSRNPVFGDDNEDRKSIVSFRSQRSATSTRTAAVRLLPTFHILNRMKQRWLSVHLIKYVMKYGEVVQRPAGQEEDGVTIRECDGVVVVEGQNRRLVTAYRRSTSLAQQERTAEAVRLGRLDAKKLQPETFTDEELLEWLQVNFRHRHRESFALMAAGSQDAAVRVVDDEEDASTAERALPVLAASAAPADSASSSSSSSSSSWVSAMCSADQVLRHSDNPQLPPVLYSPGDWVWKDHRVPPSLFVLTDQQRADIELLRVEKLPPPPHPVSRVQYGFDFDSWPADFPLVMQMQRLEKHLCKCFVHFLPDVHVSRSHHSVDLFLYCSAAQESSVPASTPGLQSQQYLSRRTLGTESCGILP
jgi:hypothetical protein